MIDTTDVSAGRQIEVEIGWCSEDPGYVGTIHYPPDGTNPWIILYEANSPSLLAVRSGLRAAIQEPAWPCRHCSDWMLAQTTMFLTDGICDICEGAKAIANTDLSRISALIEEIDNG